MSSSIKLSFKKGGRKPNVLTIARSNGTTTYVKFKPPMELHDLAHYAVEKVIAKPVGFYWMIDQGFVPGDFEKARHLRPAGLNQLIEDPDNLAIEFIVNQLMIEALNSGPSADFIQLLDESMAEKGANKYTFDLTPNMIDQMRQLYVEVLQQWQLTLESQTLELHI